MSASRCWHLREVLEQSPGDSKGRLYYNIPPLPSPSQGECLKSQILGIFPQSFATRLGHISKYGSVSSSFLLLSHKNPSPEAAQARTPAGLVKGGVTSAHAQRGWLSSVQTLNRGLEGTAEEMRREQGPSREGLSAQLILSLTSMALWSVDNSLPTALGIHKSPWTEGWGLGPLVWGYREILGS